VNSSKSKKWFSLSNRGFLFTISVIIFASTLVLYAQHFSDSVNSNERSIILASQPVNIFLLNDDLANGVASLLGLTVDINQSINSTVLISGVISQTPSISSAFLGYSSFLSGKFFPSIGGTHSLNLSNLSDGTAELFFGNNLEFDSGYTGHEIAFYKKSGASIVSLDLNLHSSNSLQSIEWAPNSSGQTLALNLNYSDDANSFSIHQNISVASLSSLRFVYSDGDSLLSLGAVSIGGVNKNSAMLFTAMPTQKVSYVLKGTFGNEKIAPARFNSVLSSKLERVDSNSYLTLYR